MWNRVTQQNINSFEDFISIYKLCKSRGNKNKRLKGDQQAYDALLAAEDRDEQRFKRAWRALKLFSRKTRNKHADRMFFDFAVYTCRSWTDLVLCNLSAYAASLACKWIDEEMTWCDDTLLRSYLDDDRRHKEDKVAWRKRATSDMYQVRSVYALRNPGSDIRIENTATQFVYNQESREMRVSSLERDYLTSILEPDSPVTGLFKLPYGLRNEQSSTLTRRL